MTAASETAPETGPETGPDPTAVHRLGGPLWKPIVVVLLVVGAIGGVGDQLTTLNDWYFALEQPGFKPPDWAFPIGWSVIYVFTGVSAVLAWQRASATRLRVRLLIAHLITAVINMGWSLVFFTLQRPDWAFLEGILLWLAVAVLTVLTARCDSLAGLLMLPYLAWVTFAGAMTWQVSVLNGPFPMGG